MPLFASSGQAMLTKRQMYLRILWFILGFYVLLNPTPYNLANGIVSSAQWLMMWQGQQEIRTLLFLVLALIVLVIVVILARRFNQALKDTNMTLLGLQTAAVALSVGILCYALVVFNIISYQGWPTISAFLSWGWQTVLGFAMGKGMNWNIEDRRMAGIQGTQEVNAGHGADHHPAADGQR